MPEAITLHTASALVKTRPKDVVSVAERIAALPFVETRAADWGRIVVVLEGPDARTVGRLLDDINAIDGVLSAALVGEHAVPAHQMA